MGSDCTDAVLAYLGELQQAFEVVETKEGCLIITPYMRRDNDYIELGIEPQPDGRIRITDYSATINYLQLSGLNISRSREVRRLLGQIGERFSVQVGEEEIFTLTDREHLGTAVQSVISASVDAAYLVYKRIRRPPLSFADKVEKVLIAGDIRYDSGFSVRGRATEHTFRFHVDDEQHALVEPLSAVSSYSALVKAERLALWWVDVAEVHREFRKIAVIDDDVEKARLWYGRPVETLSAYSDMVIRWTSIQELPRVLSLQ